MNGLFIAGALHENMDEVWTERWTIFSPPPFCLALFLRSHLAVFIKKKQKQKNNEKKDLNVSGLL